ncbi:MAG: oxidoreductase [Marinilabiliales bacterium]|nr:MAG: oxidoreductase [Marinilabiliales bacterium]
MEFPKLIHGMWRLNDWNFSDNQLLGFVEELLDLGIDTIDNADIYGGYTCEAMFGNILKMKPSLRHKIKLITKCGIKLNIDKYPERSIKTYDYSYDHILTSVENSLRYLNTDFIDLLLLHRPSPMMNAEEVAKAFSKLTEEGKVLNFGVSNFNPLQYQLLNSVVDKKLINNQVEISPFHLEHFDNGNLEFFQKEKIIPTSWSPLAGGRIFNPQTEREIEIKNTMVEVGEELGTDKLDQVALAWLFAHPSGIIPILGSGNINRIKSAVASIELKINLEQWFKIYNASRGEELP